MKMWVQVVMVDDRGESVLEKADEVFDVAPRAIGLIGSVVGESGAAKFLIRDVMTSAERVASGVGRQEQRQGGLVGDAGGPGSLAVGPREAAPGPVTVQVPGPVTVQVPGPVAASDFMPDMGKILREERRAATNEWGGPVGVNNLPKIPIRRG
jgi:hypothetical protein